MHRQGGKRIQMDDHPPPQYESPMTPLTPMDHSNQDMQESYTPYTPYTPSPGTPLTHNAFDPVHLEDVNDFGGNLRKMRPDMFPDQYDHQAQYHPQTQPQTQYDHIYDATPQYEAQYHSSQQDQSLQYDQLPQFEQPMTPISIAGRTRAGRARSRGGAAGSVKRSSVAPSEEEPTRKRRQGRRHADVVIDDEASLYNIIWQGKSSLQQIADDWIEAYKVNRDFALLTLMQFIVNSSGCKGKITPNMQASLEHAAIIRKMTEEFDEESGEYPLIMTGQQWKKFRSSFCDFIQILVKQCQYAIIYDQYLMDNVISLLTGLSDSQVRAFRHTATLAAMKLMTALVDVALTVSVNLDNTQRQYETERQKTRDKRATDRLESLMSKRQELEENMDEIKNMLTYMFKSVFVHRYRLTCSKNRMKTEESMQHENKISAGCLILEILHLHCQYKKEDTLYKENLSPRMLSKTCDGSAESADILTSINHLLATNQSFTCYQIRDTLPEIRSICMTEIGVWMKKFHQNFLDDSYLKYIGWTLHDKVGEVRLRCLQALQPLYASEELKGKLELFTSKFKDRIVSMTLDKENEVAVHAIWLVISILKHHRDILTDKDCEYVYELVYSSHRAVAQAAGEFLNERLFILDEEDNLVGIRTKRGKKRLPNTPLIRDLVQFFIESELHEHGAYLVDSLIESNEMMKDWECMTDLLLEEPGPAEEPLDDRQETSLIELMVCCIRQTATGEPPVGRGPTRKILSAKDMKQIQDDKGRLTDHFIPLLPALLAKYMADPEKVTNLLSIPQYFDLEIYTTSRQEKGLELLLKLLQEIVEKHTDTDVLETCAKTLEVLCGEDYAIITRCSVAQSTVIDLIVNRYREAIDEYNSLIDGEEEPDEDETFSLINSLKKVSIFYTCHNIGPWNLWDSFFRCIKEAKEGNNAYPDEAIKYCISSCFFGILWDQKILEDAGDRRGLSQDLEILRARLVMFIDAMKEILYLSSNQMLKEEAFITICDLLIVFSSQLKSIPLMEYLVYEPDRTLPQMLNSFVQSTVLIGEDNEEQDDHLKIEHLHRRRNLLASLCKLIVYNIVPMRIAADIFRHYVKFYSEFGDIIKVTINKTREINKITSARTMLRSLVMQFNEMMIRRNGMRVGRQHEDFVTLKELAKRFALSFGPDAVKNREAVTTLHREGILFAGYTFEDTPEYSLAPHNLLFLEILVEFSSKLLKQDKRVVRNFLDQHIKPGIQKVLLEEWEPLLVYRNSLVHGDNDMPSQVPKRTYNRRRENGTEAVVDDEEMGEEEEQEVEPPAQAEKPPTQGIKIWIRRTAEDDSNTYQSSVVPDFSDRKAD